ncbi:MAG: acyl-homoserine-lactone synthase [Rhodobacter sp.]|nr:acyl-homoserine-lactone synthase [Rhodobacter sp.]
MRNITFDLSSLHEHGSAFFDFLALRKRHFVDSLGWDIPHNKNYEMDQYDNPEAYYSLALYHGEVVGGVRLMPTSTTWGKHTYMLRDAFNHRIDGIPPDMLEAEITSTQVWEMTRLVISDELRNPIERNECLSTIGEGLQKIADTTDCQEFVGLTSPTLVRALRRLGFVAENGIKRYRDAKDGRTYGVLRIPVHQSAHLIAAE